MKKDDIMFKEEFSKNTKSMKESMDMVLYNIKTILVPLLLDWGYVLEPLSNAQLLDAGVRVSDYKNWSDFLKRARGDSPSGFCRLAKSGNLHNYRIVQVFHKLSRVEIFGQYQYPHINIPSSITSVTEDKSKERRDRCIKFYSSHVGGIYFICNTEDFFCFDSYLKIIEGMGWTYRKKKDNHNRLVTPTALKEVYGIALQRKEYFKQHLDNIFENES